MLETFWYVVILSSVAWYGFLVFYVGYKGFFDIIEMTQALNRHHAENQGVFAASAGRTTGLKAGRLPGLCGKNIRESQK